MLSPQVAFQIVAYDIRTFGDPVLTSVAEQVENIDGKIVRLSQAMLQAMYNGSDSFTEEELKENIYWQYFCGYEYLQANLDVSEATIRRFRNDSWRRRVLIEILKELLGIGLKVGALKKKTWNR